jgi:site-specific DNA recombinase
LPTLAADLLLFMPNSSENPYVAIYARVSTEEQREGQTIDSQVAELERFANNKSWWVAGIYKDEGWSGSLLARPELDRLRDDASAAKFSRVLINDVDRLARDVAHLGIVKRDLERLGVEVVFRKLPAEKSPTYNLMVNILGSFAEFEREMIADRTRRGRRHKVEARQQFLGTKPAYGYNYVPKDHAAGQDGYLEILSEEAAVVRLMYSWVDQDGLSAHKVMERLSTTSIRPRKGGSWAKSSVLRILRSEIYAGVWHYNKHYSCEPQRTVKQVRYRRPKSSTRLRSRSEWLPVILPAHLRIIERDQWQRVQRQLSNNITFSPRNSKHLYLLKGLVRCGGCNAMYVGDPCHGKFYYRCHQRCKKTPTIREHMLDQTVWGAIEEAVLNPSLILDQVARRQKQAEQNSAIVLNESAEISRSLRQAQEEESRILEAYRTGVISPAQLGRELEKLQIRKSSLDIRKRNIAENGKVVATSTVRRSVTDYCRQIARRLKSFTDEDRQRFLRLVVNSIVFESKQIRIRGVIPVNPAPGNRHDAAFAENVQGGFATTMAQHPGRIPDRTALTRPDYGGRNSVPGPQLEFDLIKPIVKAPPPLLQRNDLGQFVRALSETRKAA